MPTYILHGFRWPRQAIRVHVVLNNIDDAQPEWVMSPASQASILDNLHRKFPSIMARLPSLQLIEQYDEKTLPSSAIQPYAFVADKVRVFGLSENVREVMSEGTSPDVWNAMLELRDALDLKDEGLDWYVVYNGDPNRARMRRGDVRVSDDVGFQLRLGTLVGFC